MSNPAPRQAVLFGCAGHRLTEQEKAFFQDFRPLGFILFARNVDNPDQLRALTDEMRASIDDPTAPILVDQEGGRVRRLKPPHWYDAPNMRQFGDLFAENPRAAAEALHINITLLSADLHGVGINVNCAPVLDVPIPGSNDAVLGNRAFSDDPFLVAGLGRVAVDAYLENGILPVIKHLPGHGRAMCDSHHELPVVTEPLDILRENDFLPFRAMSDCPLGMTAHIVYPHIDPDQPATRSNQVIREIIRDELGFDGLLISDDLSMNALTGSLRERAECALNAGCDLALHCNGDWEEMQAVAQGSRLMSNDAWEKWQAAQSSLKPAPAIDRDALFNRLQQLLNQ
ncbi:beta-N-acetylhexosaminidase [Aestuariispira insulae]|uniref:beta-N-acetylhexosaminidase n=1 Tax=Aestuariispira insulae TaxID=1461337 RepID=A0A3D9HNG0_9PROT|nr:beta-N-acetylhexosaminidase [Aestuariispira insulae]RED51033.1 beta-N-acetylhexosaminidase [Aestuariispira insulae]